MDANPKVPQLSFAQNIEGLRLLVRAAERVMEREDITAADFLAVNTLLRLHHLLWQETFGKGE